jgi:glyoxylase-like metal-dependent hydrolase (beta-lactamase superfamily II)
VTSRAALEDIGFEVLTEHLYRFQDICNVYIVRSGRRALLIDFGAGGVLDALPEIGVERVEWVLHTHHHRDQCQGDWRLAGRETKIAVPARELEHFAAAEAFWSTRNAYDMYDCSSIDNSLVQSVFVDRAIEDYSTIEWAGIRFAALPTPGHTRGSLTYLAEIDGIAYAFTGDLIHSPGRTWTLHDLEWQYAMAEGARVAAQSVYALRRIAPNRLAPSHGDVIDAAVPALQALEENLVRYVQFADRGYQTRLGPPALRPAGELVQISEHLVASTYACANFYVLLGDDGEALFFDYGLPSDHHASAGFRFVEHTLDLLTEEFGTTRPSVVIPTHYHDDHVCGIPFLQQRFGTEVWAFELFADILQRPNAYRLPCLWPQPINVARRLAAGESFEWGGHRFVTEHNPGHTWYAAAYFGEIDGRKIAIVGDEIQIDPHGRLWGNGPVWRNRITLDSYRASIDTIARHEPQLILTGHKGALRVSKADLDGFHRWARGAAESWRELAACPEEIGFALDPNVVTVDPYQATVEPGGSVNLKVTIRNHHSHGAECLIRLVVPDGWQSSPTEQQADVALGETVSMHFSIVAPMLAQPGSRIVVMVDAEIGERRLGQAAEGLVAIR